MNNLMQMSPIIGTVTLAGYVLYQQWGNLQELFGKGKVLSEAEEMDRLGKATQRTADQEERYQKLKRAEAAGKRQREARPEAEEQATKAVGEVITEGDREALIAGLTAIDEREHPKAAKFRADTEAEIARLEAEKPADIDEALAIGERLKTLRASLVGIGGGQRERATKMLEAAEADPTGKEAQDLLAKVRANPDMFPAGTEQSLDLATQGVSPSDVKGIRHKEIVDAEKRRNDRKKEDADYQRTLIEEGRKEELESEENFQKVKKGDFEDAVGMMKIAEEETKDKTKEQSKEDDLLIRDMLGEDKKQRKRTSEVFGIESFANKIQSAVGGDRDPNLVELKAIKDLMKQQLEEGRRRGQPGAVLRK